MRRTIAILGLTAILGGCMSSKIPEPESTYYTFTEEVEAATLGTILRTEKLYGYTGERYSNRYVDLDNDGKYDAKFSDWEESPDQLRFMKGVDPRVKERTLEQLKGKLKSRPEYTKAVQRH